MTDPRPAGSGLLHRCALGLWFCGLGVLGLLRWGMSHSRHPERAGDASTMMWLAGSSLVLAVGLWLLLRALHSRS